MPSGGGVKGGDSFYHIHPISVTRNYALAETYSHPGTCQGGGSSYSFKERKRNGPRMV